MWRAFDAVLAGNVDAMMISLDYDGVEVLGLCWWRSMQWGGLNCNDNDDVVVAFGLVGAIVALSKLASTF